MFIGLKRVHKVHRYLGGFKEGNIIRVAVPVKVGMETMLNDLGFSTNFTVGERILPDASLSRAAFVNSEGKCIIRRDLPMERAERYWEWSWEDWGGNIHYDSTYIPYYRYVREQMPPLAIELVCALSNEGQEWITIDPIEYSKDNSEKIKHSINLLLSLFGSCCLVDSEFTIPIIPNRTCDWEILKPGQKASLDLMERVIEDRVPVGKQSMYRRNLNKLLSEKKPEVVAVGTKGFYGYLVFAYSEKETVILESLMPNNATYILNQRWENVSKLTKSEILSQRLHVDRIYHFSSWDERISQYIS